MTVLWAVRLGTVSPFTGALTYLPDTRRIPSVLALSIPRQVSRTEAKGFLKTVARITAQFDREERAWKKRHAKLNRRIAILEGRLA